MLNELNEYANESDIVISRKSVNSLSIIALRLKEVTRALLKNLSEFYKSNKPHLVNESICGFQTVLRKFPREFSEIKDCLVQGLPNINEPESTAAFVWLLGTFGESIPEAPYVIESLMGD
jgi:AP-2 complex subunit beta-1